MAKRYVETEKTCSYLLDTSVLLAHPEALSMHPGHDILILEGSLDILAQQAESNSDAEEVLRKLLDMGQDGCLWSVSGSKRTVGGSIRILAESYLSTPKPSDPALVAGRTLAACAGLDKSCTGACRLVTKNLSQIIRADRYQIWAEEYDPSKQNSLKADVIT